MKRITLTIALVMATLMAQAQYSDLYYHRSGDTIIDDWPTYYHSWWDWENVRQEGHRVFYGTNVHLNSGDLFWMEKYYTPIPLRVVGIASSFNYYMGNDTVIPEPEYFYLYEADTAGVHEVASAEWNGMEPQRTLVINGNGFGGTAWDSCCAFNPWTAVAPIYERYFDTAVWVTDSFYVGHTAHMNERNGFYIADNNISFSPIYWVNCSCEECPMHPCTDYSLAFSTIKVQEHMNEIIQRNLVLFITLTFPIIQVDTTVPPRDACEPITGVEALPNDSSVVVTWDGFPNYTAVKLRYGRPNLPTSQWTELDVTGYTVYSLVGLEPSTRYGVSLMAMCDSCKKQTPWTEPVYFYTAADTTHHDTTGITAPSLLASQTFLQPNPANDEVTVSSSFSLKRIELHDAAGVLVYSEPSFGHQATVPLHLLRAGTYIVTIQTQYGTTHKRLVVAR